MNETILTLAELKKTLGIAETDTSRDEELGVLLAVLPDYLYDQIGAWFGSKKEATETHDYNSVIYLDSYPVINVLEVRFGYQANHDSASMRLQDATAYRWNRDGRLMLNSSFEYQLPNRDDYDDVYVKYEHGTLTVPSTVKEAAKLFAKAYWNEGANDGQVITSVQAGSYKVSYKPSEREQSLLAPYVRVRL